MIKIITDILITDLDNAAGVWKFVPIVPASGTYKSESSAGGSGRLAKITLECKVTHVIPEMRRNVSLQVSFDDGTKAVVGTNDLPATLDIKESDIIQISCKWNAPDMM